MTEFLVFNFFPVVLIEALVLRLVRWERAWICLLDSLMMNFASFICLMVGLAPPVLSMQPLGMLLFFTYAFLVEAFVLFLLERNTFKISLYSAASANLASVLYLAIDASVTGAQ